MLDFFSPPKLHRNFNTPCFGNLNNLDWPYGFSITCFGVRICLRANDPDLLEKLRNLLPADAKPYYGTVVDHYFSAILGGRVEGTRIRKFHLLYRNHITEFRSNKLDELLDAFEPAFRIAVAALAPRRIFLHAGVVGYPLCECNLISYGTSWPFATCLRQLSTRTVVRWTQTH